MKKVIKLLFITIVLFFLAGTGVFFWLKHCTATKWKDYYSDSEIEGFANKMEDTESLPKNIYEAYEFVYPGHLNLQISDMENKVLWYLISGNKEELMKGRQCFCVNAAERFENRFPAGYHSFSWLLLGHALEQATTERKCFDFINGPNLSLLSVKYKQKPIQGLSFDEAVKLIVLSESPAIYTNSPERLTQRMSEVYSKN